MHERSREQESIRCDYKARPEQIELIMAQAGKYFKELLKVPDDQFDITILQSQLVPRNGAFDFVCARTTLILQ